MTAVGAAGWSARVAHTADLDAATLRAARDLCEASFAGSPDGGFGLDDWDHCQGGMHALVHDGEALVGHAAVVGRHLHHGGRWLRTGYVEAVVVAATHRRRGVGHALMAEMERVVRAAHDLGALGASADGAALYLARGWVRWRGPTSELTLTGARRTPDDDGAVMVLPVTLPLDLDAALVSDAREGRAW